MAPALPVVRVTAAGRNAGKTLLASRLIELLTERGYVVAAVKRSHHPMPPDRAGSDTDRFARAGAALVIFNGGNGSFARRSAPRGSLQEAVSGLTGEVDLVIAEGYRDEAFGAAIRVGEDGSACLETMDGATLTCAPIEAAAAFADAIEREFALSAAGDDELRRLVRRAAANHGHLCAGVILGVRMARAGCGALELPLATDEHRLAVTVETARCATDAIATATGCSAGSGDLVVRDYGKMAATFHDRVTGRAVRVLAREEARELANDWAPANLGKRGRQAVAYRLMPSDVLFAIEDVRVDAAPAERSSRAYCSRCAEPVLESHLEDAGALGWLCVPCATGASYYERSDVAPTPPKGVPSERSGVAAR